MGAADVTSNSHLRDLAARVAEACVVDGDFLLRSGRRSTRYVDKYQFSGSPMLLTALVDELAPLVRPGDEVLAGLELGGVPIATALSLRTGLPAAFVRKQAKTYGTARLAEGAPVEGRSVLVVEDIVTTGGQVAASTAGLRERGAVVDRVLCVVDRSGGDHRLLDDAGIEVVSLFTGDDLGLV